MPSFSLRSFFSSPSPAPVPEAFFVIEAPPKPRAPPAVAVVSMPSAQVETTGFTLAVRGVRYYCPAVAAAVLEEKLPTARYEPAEELVLATVVKDVRMGLKEITEQYRKDDVWTPDFMSLILSESSGSSATLSNGQRYAKIRRTVDVSGGPYVVRRSTGEVFPVYRLYSDPQGAFLYGVLPSPSVPGAFIPLPASSSNPLAPTAIAVPSRLSCPPPSPTRPLSGLRFGLKDNIDLALLPTGLGSRAYAAHTSPAAASAALVQHLLSRGAVCIGKVKTSQFAEGEEPTAHWVDQHAPFNPRGDGYQHPSTSSTGSAVAVASYEWCDFAVGTDTGGSVRAPAGVNGVFGWRGTHGAVEMRGVSEVCRALDMVGVLARSPEVLRRVSESLLEMGMEERRETLHSPLPPESNRRPANSHKQTKQREKPDMPKRLIYLHRSSTATHTRWFPHPESTNSPSEAHQLLEAKLAELEILLGTQRELVDLDHLWRTTAGAGKGLDESFADVYTVLTTYAPVHNLIDPFVASYSQAHHGRKPFINPAPRYRQALGRELTAGDYTRSLALKARFETFLDEVLFKDGPAIVVFPQALGRPRYIDEDPGPLGCWTGFSIYALGFLGGCPEVVVPVGEAQYWSRVTERTEWLPVSLSVAAPRGCDGMVLRLVEDMAAESMVREVAVGSRLYGNDEVNYPVDGAVRMEALDDAVSLMEKIGAAIHVRQIGTVKKKRGQTMEYVDVQKYGAMIMVDVVEVEDDEDDDGFVTI